jgi:hypothetical protein
MSLLKPCVNTSHNVTSIENQGFWLLVDEHEYFVPFADYPAFYDATVAQIYNVARLSPEQFHWPDLDVDIELEALKHLDRFSLIFEPYSILGILPRC